MNDTRLTWFRPRLRKQGDTGFFAEGVCRRERIPVETFYSPFADAREICDRCPVARQCRDHAFHTEERYGIWGGCDFGNWELCNDPRVTEAFKRVYHRLQRGSEERQALRRFSDEELRILARREGFI